MISWYTVYLEFKNHQWAYSLWSFIKALQIYLHIFIEFILFIEIYKQDFNIMNQEFILTTTGIARISFSVYKTVLFGYLIHFFFCHQPHPSWKCNNKNGTVTIYGGGIKFIWKRLLLLPKFYYNIMVLYCVIFIYKPQLMAFRNFINNNKPIMRLRTLFMDYYWANFQSSDRIA